MIAWLKIESARQALQIIRSVYTVSISLYLSLCVCLCARKPVTSLAGSLCIQKLKHQCELNIKRQSRAAHACLVGCLLACLSWRIHLRLILCICKDCRLVDMHKTSVYLSSLSQVHCYCWWARQPFLHYHLGTSALNANHPNATNEWMNEWTNCTVTGHCNIQWLKICGK